MKLASFAITVKYIVQYVPIYLRNVTFDATLFGDNKQKIYNWISVTVSNDFHFEGHIFDIYMFSLL